MAMEATNRANSWNRESASSKYGMNNKHEASRDKIVEEAYREEDIQNLEQREWETVIKS